MAKDAVVRAGFAHEVDWQYSASPEDVDESGFLRETGWVILSSGMRESVVRNLFPAISTAFCDWASAGAIVANSRRCVRTASRSFSHPLKLHAIVSVAETLQCAGFEAVMSRLLQDGVDYLIQFPFIGPVTCYHLGKNLGLDVAKPDRHLVRLAAATGFDSVHALCSQIHELTGDRVSVVDIVLWRYATLDPNYVASFTSETLTDGHELGESIELGMIPGVCIA